MEKKKRELILSPIEDERDKKDFGNTAPWQKRGPAHTARRKRKGEKKKKKKKKKKQRKTEKGKRSERCQIANQRSKKNGKSAPQQKKNFFPSLSTGTSTPAPLLQDGRYWTEKWRMSLLTLHDAPVSSHRLPRHNSLRPGPRDSLAIP